MTVTERTEKQCDSCGVTDTHAHHIQFIGIIHSIASGSYSKTLS